MSDLNGEMYTTPIGDLAEYSLDKVLEALRTPEVRQQIVLEIDPLEAKMTVQMVGTAVDAIIAVLGKPSG